MNPSPATTSQQALSNLQNFQSSAQNPQQLISGANQSLGVDQAQQQVSGLQKAIGQTTNLLNQVAPSVMGRTQNSLVTSAQANNQIAQQSAPIQTNLQNDTQAYNQANTDYSNKEQQAQSLVNAELAGQANQQSYLQGIYNDLAQSEQTAAAAAEAKREFDAQQAAAAKASGSGNINLGGTGGGSANSLAASSAPNLKDPGVIFDMIQALRQSPGGVQKYNWGALANLFQKKGIDVTHGSPADQALNSYFNQGTIKNAPPPGSLGQSFKNYIGDLQGMF